MLLKETNELKNTGGDVLAVVCDVSSLEEIKDLDEVLQLRSEHVPPLDVDDLVRNDGFKRLGAARNEKGPRDVDRRAQQAGGKG